MLNIQIFKYLNSFAGLSDWGDQAIVFCATILGIILIGLATLFLFYHVDRMAGENAWFSFRRKVREITFVFFISAIAWGVSTLLKNLLLEPRPFEVLDGVTKLFSPDDPFSFPSGHATFFSALATALFFYHKRLGLLFGLGALIIGISRVISGIHYPADILTGFGVGILVAILVAYLRKKV